jgi:hypothetical protein
MNETEVALNRIADLLKEGLNPPFSETALGAFLLLIVGAGFGYALQEYFANRKERKQRAEKRSFLITLLGDEINLRWNDDLMKHFGPHLGENLNQDVLDELCETQFHPEDLFIFKQLAENLDSTMVLEDKIVISSIVHVRMLTRDLIDGLYHLNVAKKKHDQGCRDDGSLEKCWKVVKSTIMRMDYETKTISDRIKDEYLPTSFSKWKDKI